VALIGLESCGAGPAGTWAATIIATLGTVLRRRGHQVADSRDASAPPDLHLLLGARPASWRGGGWSVAVADAAEPASLDLAARLYDVLPPSGDSGEDAMPWPVLGSHADHALAACACGVRLLSGQERHADFRDRLVVALADAITGHVTAMRSQHRLLPTALGGIAGTPRYGFRPATKPHAPVDLWYEVPLIPQDTDMSCWAAAAAMIVGWRDRTYVGQQTIAQGLRNDWNAYREGLHPEDVTSLARVWGLAMEPPRTYATADLERLLAAHGPLWVGQADPDLHVICVVGLTGDGTADGTLVRINDPWPPGRGERYSITLGELATHFHSASAMMGLHVQILHARGRVGMPAAGPMPGRPHPGPSGHAVPGTGRG
jgi:hypothetical protein